MANANMLNEWLLKELEAEETSTRKCLERIPEKLMKWKPHEKSMEMGYLALIVAEIPKWITYTIEFSEIDFASFKHIQWNTTSELVNHFEENLKGAKNALQYFAETEFSKPFFLKMNGKVLMSIPKADSVGQSINHLAHHRGQLTVYMRLNNILVPKIYGPSADDKTL
jgi:uncharacterized damage-inducible protein DinB